MAGAPAVQDLMIKGQEIAGELKELLLGDEAAAAGDAVDRPLVAALLAGISGSFARALELLSAAGAREQQERAPTRRAGSKRRICLSRGKKILKKSTDDGYSWRKYGQKDILSARFPRSYFRCSHKRDQDCQATRHVQRSEHDPSVFEITYLGEHTCNPALASSGEGTSACAAAGSAPPPPAAPAGAVKREGDEDAASEASQGCLSDELHRPGAPGAPGAAHFGGAVTGDGDDMFSVLQSLEEVYSAGSIWGPGFDSFEQYRLL